MKIILAIILMMFLSSATREEEPVRTYYLPEIVVVAPTVEQEIFRTVIDCGYDTTMAKLLVAQSRHETGNWKSRLARKANNVFGMHHSKSSKRATGSTVAEKKKNFATYESVEESTLEALDWLVKRDCPMKFKNSYEYAKWLKSKGYYEDTLSNYSNALRANLKQIKI